MDAQKMGQIDRYQTTWDDSLNRTRQHYLQVDVVRDASGRRTDVKFTYRATDFTDEGPVTVPIRALREILKIVDQTEG